MKEWWFRFCIQLAWLLVPDDWAFYEGRSFERAIHSAVRSASIDCDRLLHRRALDRIEGLKAKGTQR